MTQPKTRSGTRKRAAPAPPPKPEPLLPDEFVFAHDLDPEVQDWLWYQIIPAGALTIVAGAPGVSKSSLLIHVAAELTKGNLDGDLRGQPLNVLYMSREDSAEKSLVPKLMAAGAWEQGGRRDGDGQVIFIHPKRLANMAFPRDNSKLAQMLKQYDIKVVVLDSLMSFMETERSLHGNYQAAVESMAPLAEMCAKAGATLIGVMHLKKEADTASLNSIIGSVGISATARHVVMIGSAPLTDSKVIGVVKSNLGPDMVGWIYDVAWKRVGDDDESKRPIYGSKVEVVRPATQDEVANMLEKRKTAYNDAQQLIVLAAMADKEQRTTAEVYTLCGNEVGVQRRQFRRILEKLVSFGRLDEFYPDGPGSSPKLVINARGLEMVAALVPAEPEGEQEDDLGPPTPRRKITVRQVEDEEID